MARVRTAVFVSGSGSNLQALIDAAENPDYPAQIALVVSNKKEAYALERARNANIPVTVIENEQEAQLAMQEHNIELICLAGFMKILSADFVNAWSMKILNIHPSLLPAHRGLHAQQQALDDGVKFSGCTVHFVTPEMDAGPIIVQAIVPVLPEDTSEILAKRILVQEHKCYPLALKLVAADKVSVAKDAVKIQQPHLMDGFMMNPVD